MSEAGGLYLARFQLLYMIRPHCRAKCSDKFLDRVVVNLTEGGMDNNGDLFAEIMARVIASCRPGPNRREELLSPCIDALDILIAGGEG